MSVTGFNLPRATPADLHRFEAAVRIKDPAAFAAALDAFMQEKVDSVGKAVADRKPMAATLADKAKALHVDTAWSPGPVDIQRGRRVMLEAFDRPQNLPLPEFARLAHKSRQQIYKDLAAQPPRLLALSVGPRRQRLPDWQLDPLRSRLTRDVLKVAEGIDAWTIYRALSDPLDGLRQRSPIEAVSAANLPEVVKAVCNALGVH